MGQEIDRTRFTAQDFARFRARVAEETEALARRFEPCPPEPERYVAGFELEACLVRRDDLRPLPANTRFLQAFDPALATAELAAFNIEFNAPPRALRGRCLSALHEQLRDTLTRARRVAAGLDGDIVVCGILPTLREADLSLDHMSPLKRYQALNEQILALRGGAPLRLDIKGRSHLVTEHRDVMLEAAATSFQLHYRPPCRRVRAAYNASLVLSAPLVAAGANSPFLFGHDLWDETRIPLFEQSVEAGGYGASAHGPLHRVSFGSGYARRSILEVFRENLTHFPPLLPLVQDEAGQPFAHLRLHNGTLWRWNRPLVGFDADGTPHIRLEHRVLPGGPSVTDMIANAALYYGLVRHFEEIDCTRLEFALARDNFYQAARLGLAAHVTWLDGRHHNLRQLLLRELLPAARRGLDALGIDRADRDRYLGVIEARVASRRTGAHWQRAALPRCGGDFTELTRRYHAGQCADRPVHEWEI